MPQDPSPPRDPSQPGPYGTAEPAPATPVDSSAQLAMSSPSLHEAAFGDQPGAESNPHGNDHGRDFPQADSFGANPASAQSPMAQPPTAQSAVTGTADATGSFAPMPGTQMPGTQMPFGTHHAGAPAGFPPHGPSSGSAKKPVSTRGYKIGILLIVLGVAMAVSMAISISNMVDGWRPTPIKPGSTVTQDLDTGTYEIMAMTPAEGGFSVHWGSGSLRWLPSEEIGWGQSIEMSITAPDGQHLSPRWVDDTTALLNGGYRSISVATVHVDTPGTYTISLGPAPDFAPTPRPVGLGLVELDARAFFTRIFIAVLSTLILGGTGLVLLIVTFFRRRSRRRQPPHRASYVYPGATVQMPATPGR